LIILESNYAAAAAAAVKLKPVGRPHLDASLNFVTNTFQIETKMCLKNHNLPVD